VRSPPRSVEKPARLLERICDPHEGRLLSGGKQLGLSPRLANAIAAGRPSYRLEKRPSFLPSAGLQISPLPLQLEAKLGLVTESERGEVVHVGMDLVAAGLAAIPLVGGTVAGIFQAETNREFRTKLREQERKLELLGQIVEDLQGRVVDLKEAANDPDRLELLEAAATYAASARSADARRLIARVTAMAIIPTSDSNLISRAFLLLDTVSQLHPEHVKVLLEFGMIRSIGDAYFSPSYGPRTRDSFRSWIVPDVSDIIDPILARLDGLGLIRVASEQEPGVGSIFTQRPEQWTLTPFGVEVSGYLHSRPDDH